MKPVLAGCPHSDISNNGVIEKYCFNNDTNYCETYGSLYDWDEMMQYNPSNNGTIGTTQGICPNGWHIPTHSEWKELEMYLGMSQSDADATGSRGTDESGKLKETGTTHWNNPNTVATNESGFTALPRGIRSSHDGSSSNLGHATYFWSATENDSSNAWFRFLGYSISDVYRNYGPNSSGFTVKCLKD